jgi:SanA protein
MMRILRLILKISPLVFVVALVTDGLEKKNKKKISVKRIVLILALIGVVLVGSAMAYVRAHYDDAFTQSTNGCAVVFGAAVWKDDQPSHALNDRTQAAIELYNKNQVQCLIFSGGESKIGTHEAEVMKRLALEAGVNSADIKLDYFGNNTLATIINLANDVPYVLVSNDFHMARIGLIAKRIGLEEYHLHSAPYKFSRYDKNGRYFWREVGGTLILWFGL